MKHAFLVLGIIALVLVAGCIEQEPEKEITSLMIPGHGQQIYEFSFDIKKSIEVPSNDPLGIKDAIWNTSKINIVFDGTNEENNGYFRVTLINIIIKLQTFFAYEGKLIDYATFYYVDDQWYDEEGSEIEKPVFDDVVLWLLGPETGATETSVNLEDNIIYVQGTSYDELVMAGDRFSLIFMGVENIA